MVNYMAKNKVKDYLYKYGGWLTTLTKDDFIRMVKQANFNDLKDLSYERVCEADKEMGQESYEKSIKELKREFEEEVSDSIFYLYLICSKKN